MRKPKGHVRRHGTGFQAIVPIGLDPITKRYRYRYAQADTEDEARAARDRMLADLEAGRQPREKASFSQLLDEVLEIADLDFTTRGMYRGYIERTIRPALGGYDVRYPELLDLLYAKLRRCRKLCGGRRGLVDHRSAGRGKRLADGTPDHECDERCRQHQCRPAEPATVAQIHAIIKGTLGYAVRWKWIDENPAASASPPEVTAEHADPPDPDEAVRLLAVAEDHSRVMAVIIWLALVTGARRGELCALRWPDVNEAECDLLIGGSYAVRQGQRQVKATKTHRKRRMALDPGTIEMLMEYKEHCRKEALAADGEFNEDGFVFSSDGFGEVPWNPDTIGKWFRQMAASTCAPPPVGSATAAAVPSPCACTRTAPARPTSAPPTASSLYGGFPMTTVTSAAALTRLALRRDAAMSFIPDPIWVSAALCGSRVSVTYRRSPSLGGLAPCAASRSAVRSSATAYGPI